MSEKTVSSPVYLENIYEENDVTVPPSAVYMNNGESLKQQTHLLSSHAKTFLVNVNGRKFEVSNTNFSKLEPYLALGGVVRLQKEDGCTEYFVERHAPSFAAILDYFQTGELHMPPDVCPGVFRRELEHWGVSWRCMTQCCLRKYIGFQQNEQSLEEFDKTIFNGNPLKSKKTQHSYTSWENLRQMAWAILDDPRSSVWAKVYIAVATTFVLLSVFVLAASTHPVFMRGLTAEEWAEFFTAEEKELYWSLIDPWGFNRNPLLTRTTSKQPNMVPPPSSRPTTSQPPASSGDITTDMTPSRSSHNPLPHVGKRSVGEQQKVKYQSDGETPSTNKNWQESQMETPTNNVVVNHIENFKTGESGEDDGDNERNYIVNVDVNGNKEGKSHLRGDKSYSLSVDNTKSQGSKHEEWEGRPTYFNPSSIETELQDMDAKISKMDDTESRIDEIVKELLQKVVLRTLRKLGQENHDTKDSVVPKQSYEDNQENVGTYQETFQELEEPTLDDLQFQVHYRSKRSAQNVTGNSNSSTSNCHIITAAELNRLLLLYSAVPPPPATARTLPSNVFAVADWLQYLDIACLVYFTVEYIIRLIFAPNRCRYLLSFYTVLDLVSILTTYLVLILNHVTPRQKYTSSYVDVINCMQLVRVFRFFRLVKDVTGFRVLIFSLRSSWRELLLLVLYILMAIVIFSSMAYFCEREYMGSIPEASWWVIITMTTVGYGDVSPQSGLGKLVGSACALSGVLLIAVTVPVFVNNFILFYEHSKIYDAHDDKGETDSLKLVNGQESSKSSVTESDSLSQMEVKAPGHKKYAFEDQNNMNYLPDKGQVRHRDSPISANSKRSNTSLSKVTPLVSR